MEEPLISIITVTFNSAKTLERTILSVINQSYQNIEYIIIDGGSSDSTIDIIKKYQSFIGTWVSEKDNGIYDAMNKGINLANGEIIGTLNSDDWLFENAVENIALSFQNNKFDVFAGAVQIWNNDQKDKILYSDLENLPKYMSIHHPATFISKSAYQKFGIYPTQYRIAGDYCLMLLFLNNKANFIISRQLITNMSLGGASDTKWKIGLKESFQIKSQYYSIYWSYIEYIFYVVKDSIIRAITSTFLKPIYIYYKKFKSKFTNKFDI